jgi:hypothetical protein
MKYERLLTEIIDILITDRFKEHDDVPPETIAQAKQIMFDTFSLTWDICVNAAIEQGYTEEALKTFAVQVFNRLDLERMAHLN